jgi:hypothetical protein
VLAGCAGVLAAIGVASSLTQAAPGTPVAATATTTAPTTTTQTTTTPTTTTPAKTTKSRTATRTITCRAALVATQPPLSTSTEDFGTLRCSAPFGSGVQHDTATVTRTSPTGGSFVGGLKLFYNTGALRGTYRMAFTVAGRTVTYTGTMRITSGTGAFRGVTGKGTISGTSRDAVRSTITDRLTLKIPRKRG